MCLFGIPENMNFYFDLGGCLNEPNPAESAREEK